MTNRRVVEMADTNKIGCEVERRRWNCLGHLLRREGVNDFFAVLGWTPECQRARGRPKTSWRGTVERGKRQGDMEELDCGWGGDTQQGGWADNVTALSTYWPNEQ